MYLPQDIFFFGGGGIVEKRPWNVTKLILDITYSILKKNQTRNKTSYL